MHRQTAELNATFEIKSERADTVTFLGIASTDGVDQANDVICAGAFLPIQKKTNGEPTVLLLRDHDRTQVIGGWRSIEQDGHDLLVEGEILSAVAKGQETIALLRKGYLSGLSVGFTADPKNVVKDHKTNARLIRKALLREISIVSMPCNQSARIVSVKHDLAAFGLSDDDAEVIIKGGIDALIERRAYELDLMREIETFIARVNRRRG
ncbi:HK97 family phage prohead protease [Bradyrhizobium diazoefficiens]|nr:HK97 family phage prohead protease [Bradyrhizobium diazoefficiens]MBR0778549.1 HK97 family phage prohead protease [Bradyrhizobium diazoefficiens]